MQAMGVVSLIFSLLYFIDMFRAKRHNKPTLVEKIMGFESRPLKETKHIS